MKKLALFLILSISVLFCAISTPAKQIYFDLDLSLGQNTNITQTQDGEEGFFSQARLFFNLPFALNNLNVELFSQVDYIEYAKQGTDLNTKIGAACSKFWLDDKLSLTLSAAGSLYRTDILPEDEMNQVEIELRLDHRLSLKNELFLSNNLAYEDYLQDYTLGPKHLRPLSNKDRKGKGRELTEKEHENLINTARLGLGQIISPAIESEYFLEYQVCASKVKPESFQGVGLGAEVYLYPAPKWETGFGSKLTMYQFQNIKARKQRKDFEIQAWISLLRRFERFNLFYSLTYFNNQSSWKKKEFEGMVNKCGLFFAF